MILLISDLHLSEREPHLLQLFQFFIKTYAYQAQALYILGDLFEVWIGDDDLTPFHQSVMALLKTLTEVGVPVYLMSGNRDFLLGKRFCTFTGCTLIPDPYSVSFGQERVLLTHGDSLCSDDQEYMVYRTCVRSWMFKYLFLRIPLWMRQKIAQKARYISQHRRPKKLTTALDVNLEAVQAQFKQYLVTTLIHGHIHRPGRYQYFVDKKPVERIVLGAWHERGNALIFRDDQKQWVEFDPL